MKSVVIFQVIYFFLSILLIINIYSWTPPWCIMAWHIIFSGDRILAKWIPLRNGSVFRYRYQSSSSTIFFRHNIKLNGERNYIVTKVDILYTFSLLQYKCWNVSRKAYATARDKYNNSKALITIDRWIFSETSRESSHQLCSLETWLVSCHTRYLGLVCKISGFMCHVRNTDCFNRTLKQHPA